ncbi:helix-turn-helix transcriptional regulator [Niallia sp. XMNu-256]|uniref:helix-turn-helix domain-containing protein n=1 Tax=Niallia sp. XMNu-256 TaxID=3082444 RepID=UPI0030D02ECC
MGRKVKINIEELLEERNLSLRGLSLMTDIGHDKLSNLKNQNRKFIYIEHLEKIADALGIDDMNEIIRIEYRDDE